jgi:DNA end-binding protein Ku
MPPSSIWTGTIGFGLVQVPVRIVTATRNKDVSFNQLDRETGSRVRIKRVSENNGEEVPSDRIVKGFEISKGRYVVIDPSELEAIAPKSSHTIEIEEFVDLSSIDPLYFESSYYLAPDPKAAKPYRLLVDAMSEMNKVAVGKVVMRTKERLVAIRPLDGVLVISTMRYADEVVDAGGIVPDADGELSTKELAMARQLIETLTVDSFDADKYHDEYRQAVLDMIDKKAAGEEIVAPAASVEPAPVLDLVAALEQSLARVQKSA